MKEERKLPPCGNPKCCASMDIAGNITHGWGELDNLGFWEFECPWPHPQEQYDP